MERNVIIFDFEVDKYDWLLSAKYYNKDKWINIHNNPEMLKQFLAQEQNSLFVGFNNHHYDDYIISGIFAKRSPYDISNRIIIDGVPGWKQGLKKPKIASLDLKQENAGNLSLSLKEAEANMGLSIEESSVGFNLGRAWTSDEREEMLRYCQADVSATEELFKRRIAWVESKISLVNINKWPLSHINKTSAQMSALTLGALNKPIAYNDEFTYDVPQDLVLGKYSNLLNYFRTPLPKKIELEYELGGLSCVLGEGGLHGAIPKFISTPGKLYASIDAEAYYPTMMVKRNYLSRGIITPENYKKIYDIRKESKLSGNTDKSKAYKQIIVTTYGAMDNKYNNLYDPKMRKHIAITGQLFLADLIDKIEDYVTLIQANTDGIYVEIHDLEKLKIATTQWEQRTGFDLGWDIIDSLYQKDVNNYFAKFKKGTYKVKGVYLKQADVKWDGFSRNHMRVVDLAIVDYFNKGTPVDVFIKNHTDILNFQMLAKATKLFDGGLVEIKNKQILNEWGKVSRVFATTNDTKGELFKVKKGKPHKVPGLPSKVCVWNDNIKNVTKEFIQLDYNFYIEVAVNRLRDFNIT